MNQGQTTTPEGGRIGLPSSKGYENKLYRRIVDTIHCPATIKAVKDVSPKGHRRGYRLCFAKADGCCCRPVRVSAGRSSPIPMPCVLATV